ncbi:MAG: polyphenol oxidase family protein [Actinomycetota bacterium]|nr:polyphenol oxidase family protein [Actinomycetota bacterium]
MEDGSSVSAAPEVPSTGVGRPCAQTAGFPADRVAPAAGRDLLGGAHVRWSDRLNGDLAGAGSAIQRRRQQVVDLPWTVLRQVHGTRVAVVRSPGAGSGLEADAAVTAQRGAALAVLSADCAPVALASAEGVIGVAHAGWRGLAAGVLDETVQVVRSLGGTRIQAVLGPCIRTACYRFGADDLERVVERTGPEVRGLDRDGHPALDVAAGVIAALHRAGVDEVSDVGVCTGCSEVHWSWRRGGDQARQATVVWRS